MKVRITRGPLRGKKVEMATRQAKAAVAAGAAAYVDPQPAQPAPAETPPAPSGSWLGPPGEVPAATAPVVDDSRSWLGPPGETSPVPAIPSAPVPAAGIVDFGTGPVVALHGREPIAPEAPAKSGAKK